MAITRAGLFLGSLSDWMSKSAKESPSDSVFIRNNSVKVKIKIQQTNWKSRLISILKERNKEFLETIIFVQLSCNKVKASLIYKLLLEIFYIISRAEHFMWHQCRTVWFVLWFLFSFIFWRFFKYKIVAPKILLVSVFQVRNLMFAIYIIHLNLSIRSWFLIFNNRTQEKYRNILTLEFSLPLNLTLKRLGGGSIWNLLWFFQKFIFWREGEALVLCDF